MGKKSLYISMNYGLASTAWYSTPIHIFIHKNIKLVLFIPLSLPPAVCCPYPFLHAAFLLTTCLCRNFLQKYPVLTWTTKVVLRWALGENRELLSIPTLAQTPTELYCPLPNNYIPLYCKIILYANLPICIG